MTDDYKCSSSVNLFGPNFEEKECKGEPIPSSVPSGGGGVGALTLTGVAAQSSYDTIIIQTHENHIVEAKNCEEELLLPIVSCSGTGPRRSARLVALSVAVKRDSVNLPVKP
jgi:hypothetical protein